MIFSFVNRAGVHACDSVLNKQKTVTRRVKLPIYAKAGRTMAVQRKRGSKSEGRALIVSVMTNEAWWSNRVKQLWASGKNSVQDMVDCLNEEARKEGCADWKEFEEVFDRVADKPWSEIGDSTYRIEFALIQNYSTSKERLL